MDNDVKKRILSESMQLMFSHGVKAMTMDELARRMGISKRTIYEHFEDKDALLTAIFQERKKQNEIEAGKILKESKNVVHVFFHFLNITMQSDYFQTMVSRTDEVKRYHPAVYQKEIIGFEKSDFERIKGLMQLGVKQEVFRKDLDLDVVASMFRFLSNQLFDNENGLRLKFSPEKIFETYMVIFLRGIATDKGLEEIDKLKK